MNDTPAWTEAIKARLAEVSAEVAFTAGNHSYKVKGKKWPSVTTITGIPERPALTGWRVKMERELCKRIAERFWLNGNEEYEHGFAAAFEEMLGQEREHERLSREATDLGKQLHALIENWLKAKMGQLDVNATMSTSNEARALFGSWLQWAEEASLEPIAVEQRLYSVQHRFVGTCDLMALVNGEPKIFDWKSKSSNGLPYPEALQQNVAYRIAALELGLGTWGGQIVTVPKDYSGVTVHEVGEQPKELARFLALCAYWWGDK